MDLSIFDAFEKPATSSNGSNRRKSLDTRAVQSSQSQETKKRRSDVGLTSTYIQEIAPEVVESTEAAPDSTAATRSYIPAKEYKFKLDTFQQTAVDHIERGDSVLVAAHTSAGVNYYY